MLVKQPEDLEANGTVYFVNKNYSAEGVLCCKGCGAELILGYHPRCFAGIRLKCVKCEMVTETPTPDLGDVFPKGKVLTLAEVPYRVSGPVTFSEDIVFVQDEVQRQLIEQSQPSTVPATPHLPSDALERYLTLAGRDEGEVRERLKRYRQNGRSGCLEEPMMWAISVLENESSASAVEIDVATTWVGLFANMDSMWRKHPRYKDVTIDLRGDGAAFFHTLTVLAVADIWHRNNVSITFSIEDDPKKPDLYVRRTASEQHFVEIKIPTNLLWRPESSGDKNYSGYVSKIIGKNKQISRASGTKGHFVFGLFHPRARNGRDLSKAVERFFHANSSIKPSCTGADVLQFGVSNSLDRASISHMPFYNPYFT